MWMEHHLTPDSTVSTGLLKPGEDKVTWAPEWDDPKSRTAQGSPACQLVLWMLPAPSARELVQWPPVTRPEQQLATEQLAWAGGWPGGALGAGAGIPHHLFAAPSAGRLLLESPLQAGRVLLEHYTRPWGAARQPSDSQLCCGVPPWHRRHHHGFHTLTHLGQWVLTPHLLTNKVALGSEWRGFLSRKVKVPHLSGHSSASGLETSFLFTFLHAGSRCGGQHGCWLS